MTGAARRAVFVITRPTPPSTRPFRPQWGNAFDGTSLRQLANGRRGAVDFLKSIIDMRREPQPFRITPGRHRDRQPVPLPQEVVRPRRGDVLQAELDDPSREFGLEVGLELHVP